MFPLQLSLMHSVSGLHPTPSGANPSIHKTAFFFILFYIGVELIYNVVSVSGVQPSDSVIHIHIFILFQILFPYRL